MSEDITRTPLMAYLAKANPTYYGKAIELADSIRGWLEYIPNTFPHYTRHTANHSEQIIIQLSKVLFRGNDASHPAFVLNPTEIFILVAAAYLHDAGMVVSDHEKQKILTEPSWREWTDEGGAAHERWREIESLRAEGAITDPSIRHFAADLETRHLIAEYVRRVHHERAVDLIEQHQSALGRFAFDDHELQDAIAAVCVSHGYKRDALDDRFRFPLARQIRGDDVRLRLLCILFRLGDLLDLHSSRACPLILNAACPLPPDSLAHWGQYQRITHRLVTPEQIEIHAACKTPYEHRVLRDWCRWIEEEVAAAPRLLASPGDHSQWRPPTVKIGDRDATIIIKPAADAIYRDRDWHFNFDEESVLNILISSAYNNKWQFIRELTQNALDAVRCRICQQHPATEGFPKSPELFPESIRSAYRISISAYERADIQGSSSAGDKRTFVKIDDPGIGMNEHIIQNYFLQVGRSFYATQEFRHTFSFVPDSRFGVGFMSVFAAADWVQVETFKPTSDDGPIRLELTGPKNYLIVENGTKSSSGTTIELRLRRDAGLQPGFLTQYLREICRMAEVPIVVDDFGDITQIHDAAGRKLDFVVRDYSRKGGIFELRSVPVDENFIRGRAFYLVRKSKSGEEDWASSVYYRGEYRKRYPQAEYIPLPPSVVCLHGLSTMGPEPLSRDYSRAYGIQIDVRAPNLKSDLARRVIRSEQDSTFELDWLTSSLRSLRDLVSAHVKSIENKPGATNWRYLQRLSKAYDLFGSEELWAGTKMIPILRNGRDCSVSATGLAAMNGFTEIIDSQLVRSLGGSEFHQASEPSKATSFSRIDCVLLHRNTMSLQDSSSKIFDARIPSNVRWLDDNLLAVNWTAGNSANSIWSMPDMSRMRRRKIFLCALPLRGTIGIEIPRPYHFGDFFLVNSNNRFVAWLNQLAEQQPEQARRLLTPTFWDLFFDSIKGLRSGSDAIEDHIWGWRSICEANGIQVPGHLRISDEAFRMLSAYHAKREKKLRTILREVEVSRARSSR